MGLIVENNIPLKVQNGAQSGAFKFSNLKPEYIKDGVTILGMTGTYKGKILDTNLQGNTWQTIKEAIFYGSNPTVWLGQTKTIDSGALQGYHLQLVDLTKNRYERTSGAGYSQGVFQFVEILPNDYVMNQTETSAGGWAQSYMKTTIMPEIFNLLPDDIKNIITEVKVGGFDKSQTPLSALIYSDNKLFLPSEYEMLGTTTASSVNAKEGLSQLEWYKTHNVAKERISDTDNMYWLRTPGETGNLFYTIEADGSLLLHSANAVQVGVAPCFAI